MSDVLATNACRNCRRPISYVDGIGWLHEELPQYAHEESTCSIPFPVEWHCPKCGEHQVTDQDKRVTAHDGPHGERCDGSWARGNPPIGAER